MRKGNRERCKKREDKKKREKEGGRIGKKKEMGC